MATLRWERAEERAQQTLFDEPVFERQPGRGEFRGIEFLHVRAQRIVNEVKGAPFGFRHTVNAYRGCTHACSYCLHGDTPILMADGSTTPLSAVRPGDRVCGTVRVGASRRHVTTVVLDHWSTCKPAVRVTLEDGTALVASADHRFLSDRGWTYVGPSPDGTPRPHLTAAHSLLGPGSLLGGAGDGGHRGGASAGRLAVPHPDGGPHAPPPVVAGLLTAPHGPGPTGRVGGTPSGPGPGTPSGTVAGPSRRRVASIEPLGVELPMYDITTGTGDFVADGVISHNCFARPSHTYLGLDADHDFESQIVVKVNAVSRLRSELDPRRWRGEPIAMGTNTDPYQRAEGKYHLTRGIVEVLTELANPFSVLTKSTLVLRDLDLLARAARATDVHVDLSVGTLDEDVWHATEPGTPHPRRRLRAVEQLNEAGIPCGVLVAPVLPGLSDGDDQLDAVVSAAVAAGARTVSPVLLHLRPGVRDVYLDRLAATHPHLVAETRRLYRDRSYAPAADQEALATRVRQLVRAHGGAAGPRSGAETRPVPVSPRPRRGGGREAAGDDAATAEGPGPDGSPVRGTTRRPRRGTAGTARRVDVRTAPGDAATQQLSLLP